MLTLGREAAIKFMNSENSELGGRPIDLAIASEEGRQLVEIELSRFLEEHSATELSPKGH